MIEYMFIVYVLSSTIYKKSYVGFTNNMQRRLKEHNSGKHSYTKKYKPWKLIYSESYSDIKVAIEREKYFKTSAGRRHLKNIFNKSNRSGIV